MKKFDVTSSQVRSGSQRVAVYVDGEVVCDLTIKPDGKTVVLGMDAAPRSGAMPCSGGARPGWRRFRFERV